jgi:hypothetical protein
MFEQLKNKLLYWTPELANNFHENITRQGNYAWRIWETVPTGYYFYDANCAEYRDYNGDTWMLIFGDQTESFEIQSALADYHENNNFIKIQKPTLIETHKIHGLTFTLVKLVNPYGTMGIPLDQLYKINGDDHLLVDLYKKYLLAVDRVVATLDLLTNFSDNRYPVEIENGMSYDPNTNNFFISNIRYANTREQIINLVDISITAVDEVVSILGYNTTPSVELRTFKELECITLQPR